MSRYHRYQATLKRVNRAVAKAGIPLELFRGEGYHYWVYFTADCYDSVSVYMPYTNSVSVDCWVRWAKDDWETIQARTTGATA